MQTHYTKNFAKCLIAKRSSLASRINESATAFTPSKIKIEHRDVFQPGCTFVCPCSKTEMYIKSHVDKHTYLCCNESTDVCMDLEHIDVQDNVIQANGKLEKDGTLYEYHQVGENYMVGDIMIGRSDIGTIVGY